MNIIEATKKALKADGYICRKGYTGLFKPTDGIDCYQLVDNQGKVKGVRWNPNSKDIMANDWDVYASADGLPYF